MPPRAPKLRQSDSSTHKLKFNPQYNQNKKDTIDNQNPVEDHIEEDINPYDGNNYEESLNDNDDYELY